MPRANPVTELEEVPPIQTVADGFANARSIESADIYKGGQLAATLRRIPNGIEFAYTSEYLDTHQQPVAGSLPLSGETLATNSGAVPPFFAGLLPEGRRLTALRVAVKTSADDEFSLLLAVGADPIGDVSVLPTGDTPKETAPLLNVDTPIGEIRFADLLGQVGIVDPVALPGVQDKASVKGLSLPLGHHDDQFILKVDPPEHPNIVLNEAYFLGLAQRSGLPTTEFALVHDCDGRPGLLVKRFDRVQEESGRRRLECEDACQLLSRWPADKYNVTSEQVVGAIARNCDARVIAARDALRQLLFAWITGNGDVHAKNISVLRGPDGERRVAPAYDLPSTVPYNDNTMALSIGGRVQGLSRRRWIEFASTIGVREAAAAKLIDQLLDATSGLQEDLASGALPFNESVVRKLVRELRNRRKLLQAT